MVSTSPDIRPRILRDIRHPARERLHLRSFISGHVLRGSHYDLFSDRRRYQSMKVTKLDELRECAILIECDGITGTIGEWAEHFNMPKVTLAKWLRDKGPQKAFEAAAVRVTKPPKKLPVESNPNWNAPLPSYDPDLEPKNRLRSWSKRFTPDEIEVKAKMMRLA